MACLPMATRLPLHRAALAPAAAASRGTILPLVVVFLGHAGSYVYRFISNLGDVMPARRAEAAWLANATLRPWEYNEWQPELLDEEFLAYRLPHFLSEEECSHIINEIAPKGRLPLGGLAGPAASLVARRRREFARAVRDATLQGRDELDDACRAE